MTKELSQLNPSSSPQHHYPVSACLWLFLSQSWTIPARRPSDSLIPFPAEPVVSSQESCVPAKELFRRATGLISAFQPKKDLILTVIRRVVSRRPRLRHRTFRHLEQWELFLFWWIFRRRRELSIFTIRYYFVVGSLINKPVPNKTPIRRESIKATSSP